MEMTSHFLVPQHQQTSTGLQRASTLSSRRLANSKPSRRSNPISRTAHLRSSLLRPSKMMLCSTSSLAVTTICTRQGPTPSPQQRAARPTRLHQWSRLCMKQLESNAERSRRSTTSPTPKSLLMPLTKIYVVHALHSTVSFRRPPAQPPQSR